jgi:indolepyruvate ferredoxin oxidoreductase
VLLVGIGGTGIVTVNQVLATAALRANLRVHGLDQTGLSKKAGPVTSHLRIASAETEPSNRVTPGSADCIIAFDLLVATDSRYVGYGDSARTVAIASSSPPPPVTWSREGQTNGAFALSLGSSTWMSWTARSYASCEKMAA